MLLLLPGKSSQLMAVGQSTYKSSRMKRVTEQVIMLHTRAPTKPEQGKPCNGCGACCASEPCPVSLALLKQHQAPCVALEWHEQDKRYYCGMVTAPSHYLKWLPRRANRLASKAFKRWIAANQACDFGAEIISS